MKFLSFIFVLVLPILSLAQNVVISYPPEDQLIVPGQDFTVQVSLPVRLYHPITRLSTSDLCATQGSLTGSTQVSVAIGVASCTSAPCRSPADILGDVLYSGPYTPIPYSNVEPEYQNFTVSVPNGFPAGPAQLNIAHFYLVGVRGRSFSDSFCCSTKLLTTSSSSSFCTGRSRTVFTAPRLDVGRFLNNQIAR